MHAPTCLKVAGILLACIASNGLKNFEDSSAVVVLDSRNFGRITADSPMTYILFYDSKCNECEDFNSEYHKAAALLKEDHVGTFARVDNVFRNRKIYDAFGLDRDYPTHNVFCVYTENPDSGPVMTRVNPWGLDTTAEEIGTFAREHKDMLRHLWNFEEELARKIARGQKTRTPATKGAGVSELQNVQSAEYDNDGKQSTTDIGLDVKSRRLSKLQRKKKARRVELMNKQLEVLDENVDPNLNLAYERPCDASSQLGDFKQKSRQEKATANKWFANDGDRRPDFPNIFSVGEAASPSWWSVQLKTRHADPRVRVFMRDCCLEDFGYAVDIHIGNSKYFQESRFCGGVKNLWNKADVIVECAGFGQYVFVSANGTLTLAEVEVYAQASSTMHSTANGIASSKYEEL